jgi:guanine deaminase
MDLFRATVFHTPDDPFVFDLGDPRSLICHSDGALLIDRGRISACGDFEQVRARAPHAAVTDWRGGFILPGFVDAHVHFPQLRILGSLGRSLLDWLEEVALPEEARMADDVYAAETAGRFLRALVSHGTTTALVFGAHFPQATAQLFEEARRSGLRILSGLVLSDRRLGPPLLTTPARAYSDSTALIQRYHKQGRLSYAVTPRFAISTSDAMLEVCGRLMADHPDVRLQTHINESPAEVAEAARLFPWAADYLQIYERYSLSGSRSIFAHNVHTTPSQLARLAAAGAAVAHCPSSNMVLGSGSFTMSQHVGAGVRCALGTDVGGGVSFSIMKEALNAYLMQRLAPDAQPLDAARLLFLSTRGGAEAVGLASEIGDFTSGKSADFVYLQPPGDSVLESVVRHTESAAGALAALFTLATAESVREVRVEGDIVWPRAF